mmetsp:Transcript_1277/g.1725  ORF Transcript_1277/g.1725 Transcript_1277/m.1725 type:complete len:444 (+) Transcript_1277:93-1424(+)
MQAAIEIIKDKFYFLSTKNVLKDTEECHFFNTDNILCYEPFFSDFGPLNLGLTYRFCKNLIAIFKSAKYKGKKIVYYCGTKPQYKANSACLVAAYMIIYEGLTADEAYEPLRAYEPYIPFRDASQGICSYRLGVHHVCQAFEKALKFKWLDFDSFNVDEYEYFEQVENGDLNVIVPGQYIAFCGPHSTRNGPDGYPTLIPDDYFPIWKKYKVQTIIRLNKKMYDKNDFLKQGFNHHDLYFIDGTTPSPEIISKFIKISEDPKSGMMAVHCKAGLGRTGTCMGCVMMKHYDLSAAETIAWIRLCRPGSIIGPQQNYLKMQEPVMRAEGIKYRQKKGIVLPPDRKPRFECKSEEKSNSPSKTSSLAARRQTDPSRSSPTTPTKPVTRSSPQSSPTLTPKTVLRGNGAPELEARSPANRKKVGGLSSSQTKGSPGSRTSTRTKLVY